MRNGCDDEQVLDALRQAMRARQAVPDEIVETAKGVYAWHNIDAELAKLTYDSRHDKELRVSVRSETASIRALTFTSAHLSIELEVTDGTLLGQIMPPGEGTIEAQSRTGATAAAAVDEIGCFSIEPVPPSPFRLHCTTARGPDVVTGWITL